MSIAENDTRPVWLTREQMMAIYDKREDALEDFWTAWDAAPADPAEAIQRGIAIEMHDRLEAFMRREYHEGHEPSEFVQHEQMWMARAEHFVAGILAALGAPKATP